MELGGEVCSGLIPHVATHCLRPFGHYSSSVSCATQNLKSFLCGCRKEQLIEDSRHWIRAQDLEARIQEALDHPVPLY
jgi:hypothetical protein